MPTRAPSILMTVVLVLMFGAAHAQPESAKPKPAQERTFGYYRCGPQGLDLRDSPCPDGPSQALDLPQDHVDPKEAAAARKRAADESRELASRQRERERLAAQSPAPAAAGIDGSIEPRPPKASMRPSKPADPKKPKPKDPKQPPKKKPKLPKSPDPSLPPKPTTKPGKKAPAMVGDGALQPLPRRGEAETPR